MRPNLFIVGGQKCGTSALAHFLSQHPDVCLAKDKEAHVFDHPNFLSEDGRVSASDDLLDEAYSEKFLHARNERYWCDATPIYAYLPHILPTLIKYAPRAKIIFMMRDPVERAISQYTMERKRGFEQESMLKAFWLESKRLSHANNDYSWHSAIRTQSYLHRGCFIDQLARINQHIPSENVLIIHNDELRFHHQQTMQKVYTFLDVQDADIPAESVFAGHYTSPSLSERVAKLYAKAKLYREQKFVRQYAENTAKSSEL